MLQEADAKATSIMYSTLFHEAGSQKQITPLIDWTSLNPPIDGQQGTSNNREHGTTHVGLWNQVVKGIASDSFGLFIFISFDCLSLSPQIQIQLFLLLKVPPPISSNLSLRFRQAQMSSSGITIYYEPSGCNCGSDNYTKADITAACTAALQLAVRHALIPAYLHLPNKF